MSLDEGVRYIAILNGLERPDADFHFAGWQAHAAGVHFDQAPEPVGSVRSLCWRLGWNDRALWHSNKEHKHDA